MLSAPFSHSDTVSDSIHRDLVLLGNHRGVLLGSLTNLSLKVHSKKTAFIATDRALTTRLAPDDPAALAMRDLGIDHLAARQKCISVMKQRLSNAKTRGLKLRSLKLPNLCARLRLHKGGIQSVTLLVQTGLAPSLGYPARTPHWGIQAHKLIRLSRSTRGPFTLCSSTGHQSTCPMSRTLAWAQLHHLMSTNINIHGTKSKGPMAVAIIYMKEWGWNTDNHFHCHRPETSYPAATLCKQRGGRSNSSSTKKPLDNVSTGLLPGQTATTSSADWTGQSAPSSSRACKSPSSTTSRHGHRLHRASSQALPTSPTPSHTAAHPLVAQMVQWQGSADSTRTTRAHPALLYNLTIVIQQHQSWAITLGATPTCNTRRSSLPHARSPGKKDAIAGPTHRSGYQRTACQARIHQGLVLSVIETRVTEDCSQMPVKATHTPDTEPDRPADDPPEPKSSRNCCRIKWTLRHLSTSTSLKKPLDTSNAAVAMSKRNLSKLPPKPWH